MNEDELLIARIENAHEVINKQELAFLRRILEQIDGWEAQLSQPAREARSTREDSTRQK